MKKGYSTIGIIIASMLVMVGIYSFMAKDKLELKTVEGNISELGDVSFVYTPAIKDLKKEEIVISKDGVKSVIKKDKTIGREFINKSSKHNDILKYEFVENIYENEEYIGSAYIGYTYINQTDSLEMVIKEKNKSSNEINAYKIPITLKDDEKDLFLSTGNNTRYKDFIYTTTWTYEENVRELFIIKTDIKNKTSEIIVRQKVDEYLQEDLFKFSIDNKLYIPMYDTNNERTYFIIFDMDKYTLKESNDVIGKNGEGLGNYNEQIIDYNIEGNKINLLVKNASMYSANKDNISKHVYIVDGDNITLELVEDYSLNIPYSYYMYEKGAVYDNVGNVIGIKYIKMVDDKIYTVYQSITSLNRKAKNGSHVLVYGNKPVEVQVFDTIKNKIVYKGEIITGDKSIGQKLFLVKDY